MLLEPGTLIHVALVSSNIDYLYSAVHAQLNVGSIRFQHPRSLHQPTGIKGLSRIYSVRPRLKKRAANYRYMFKDASGKQRQLYFIADDDQAAKAIIDDNQQAKTTIVVKSEIEDLLTGLTGLAGLIA